MLLRKYRTTERQVVEKREIMKKFILCVIILLAPWTAIAGNNPASSLFEQGNTAYEKADYINAIGAYSQIIISGIRNSAVYYNLGNAYYKLNEPGRAVLCYKRALRLAPRDKDIRQNLEYLLSLVQEERVKTPSEKLVENLFNLISLNSLTLLASFVYLLLFISLALSIFVKRRFLFWVNISLGLVLALSGLWFYGRIDSEYLTQKGVIVVSQGEARNGPGEGYSVAFTVPEGKEVVIMQKRDQWYEIGVQEKGIKGWITKDEVEQI